MSDARYRLVAIGVSAGGVSALGKLLPALPADFPLPLVVVLHLHPQAGGFLPGALDERSTLRVKQADDKEALLPGVVYLAPPNYHLLVEEEGSLSLSLEGAVNFARPSIDVLFESAVDAFGDAVVGVVLTGANEDGARGLRRVAEAGGAALVQEPESAECDTMPRAALRLVEGARVAPLDAMAGVLAELAAETREEAS